MNNHGRLRKNFVLMFWVNALTEVKVINVISTVFYIHRGLSLRAIFLTAIVFALANLLAEVPSSYLADKWGRKKMIIVSIVLSLVYWIINLFAHTEAQFLIGFAFFGLAFAFMSGTGEALIYDTKVALKEEGESLKSLGQYLSAQRIFKIITPLIAVLIASNLTERQYLAVLMIDIVANCLALLFSFRLTEPKHVMSVEKMEVGIFKDAFRSVFKDPLVGRLTIERTIILVSTFMLWRVQSGYFIQIGTPVIWLGLATSAYQGISFVMYRKSHQIFKGSLNTALAGLNFSCLLFIGLYWLGAVFGFSWQVNLLIFCLMAVVEMARAPLYSELINKSGHGYSRATTLSMSSFTKSVLDIPLLFIAAWLSGFGYSYIFALAFGISAVTLVGVRFWNGQFSQRTVICI